MSAPGPTVYAGPPTWEPIEEALAGLRFTTPRLFLVGRSLPGEEPRMAIAWLYPSGQWSHAGRLGSEVLGWDPLFIAEAPSYPPWPHPDHPAMGERGSTKSAVEEL